VQPECAEAHNQGGVAPATIRKVLEGEGAKPRRRRNRRRSGRHSGPSAQVGADNAAPKPDTPPPKPTAPSQPDAAPAERARQRCRPAARLRTVHETSAGGLVIDDIDRPHHEQMAALIGRVDRRGRILWSLPKGHIEQGETAEQTAIREVAEETGIHGHVLAALGSIDYWFVTEGRRVHKTVHHYLMRFSGGELCDEDVEVAEVAWVPVAELPDKLAYADERRLARVAHELIERLQSDGLAALPPLPPSAPRRRPQTHSHTRNRPPREQPGVNGSGPDA